MIDTLLQDLRYALRLMRRNVAMTLIAITALAIGIGANTTMFSVVYGVLLRPLPYPHADRIVTVLERQPKMTLSMAYPDFEDMRGRAQSFESLAGAQRTNMNLTGMGEAERVGVRLVTANFFSTFGVPIAIGRDFQPDDDREGATPTVVLSYGFWQRRFGGAYDALGKTVTLGDRQYTVIGVTPSGFKYGEGIELYTPLTLARTKLWARGSHAGLVMFGRLKPGVSRQQAQTEMDTLYHAVDLEHPNDGFKGRQAQVAPLLDVFISDVQQPLWIMFAAVGFMLLIACSNVATILLARATARERELAVRNAMGATRGRVMRQMLTESVLLSVAGGVVGIFISGLGIQLLRSAKPANLPRIDDISLHPWVLVFTATVSIATGILFGLIPALHASSTTVNDILKDAGGRTTSRRTGRSRNILVAVEFALALVLLVGAGLTLKSFMRLLTVDLGFAPDHVTTFQLSLSPQRYDAKAGVNMLDRFRDDIASIPGVQNAAYSSSAPMVATGTQSFFRAEDDMHDQSAGYDAVLNLTSPEYLDTMKIRLLRGRFLTRSDRADSPKVVVIDDNLAKDVFPGQDPLGKRLKYGAFDDPMLMEIVGVVAHVKQDGPDESSPVRDQFYFPLSQAPSIYISGALQEITVVARSTAEPSSISAAVRAKLTHIDPSQPLYSVRTYDQVVSEQTEVRRFTAALLTSFAGIALFLAAIGIYGVLSYAVQQRTHEIGVRMALGATGVDVQRTIVVEAMRTVAVGLIIGLVCALALTRYMTTLLYGVRTWDPIVFGAITTLLGGVALLASYVPARRATKVDPIVALRYE